MTDSAGDHRGSERLGRYLRQLREGYGYTLRRVEEQSEHKPEANPGYVDVKILGDSGAYAADDFISLVSINSFG